MGMTLGLATASEKAINAVISDPPLVWMLLAPDDPDAYEMAREESGKGPLLKRLFGGSSKSGEQIVAQEDVNYTDLDKAWHGIHYLLTGTDWGGDAPWNFLLLGGRELSSIDVGYGAPRLLAPREVAAFSRALSTLSDDELRSRYHPADMMAKKIYPETWDRDSDTELGYLMDYYLELKTFLLDASTRGLGAVIALQ